MIVAVSASAVTRPDLGGPTGAEPAAQATPQSSFSPPPARPTDAPLPVKKVDFSTDLGQFRVGAFQIGPAAEVTGGYTELPVYHDGTTLGGGSKYPLEVATITVYRKGVYDTAMFGGVGDSTLVIGDEYPVTVGGREARGRDWTYGSTADASNKRVMSALAWQFADDAWATLLPNFGGPDLSRDQAARIAAGLTTATRRDLKVPYRLGFVPDGWQAVAVRQSAAETSNSLSEVFLHQGPVAEPATRIDEVLPGHLKISVVKGLDPGKADYTKEEGVHCSARGESCSIIHGDYRIDLAGYGGTLPGTDIKKIAEGLRLQDLADQNTWVKADF